MKRLLIILILMFSSLFTLSASDYIESKDYLKIDSLKGINDIVEAEKEDFRAFYLLDQKIKKNDDLLKRDALILKGWLSYRYGRYPEAIESWEKSLTLSSNSYNSWVNLWLSWLYLRDGNMVDSLITFKNVKKIDLRDSQDESLYLTLKKRLTYFSLPIKENSKLYLDFISFIEPYNEGVFLGNLYGGVAYYDKFTSRISVIEKSTPSMKGNPISSFVTSKKNVAPNGFFYSDRDGLFFVSYENQGKRKKLPSLPVKSDKNNFVRRTILFKDNLIVQFSKEGLWTYKTSENKWEFITKDIDSHSFLLIEPSQGNSLLFLDKRSRLTSFLTSIQGEEEQSFIDYNISLEKNYFNPILINANEFLLATPSGDLYKIVLNAKDSASLITLKKGQKAEQWLAVWKGKRSGLLNVINNKGFWQRLDSQGNVIASKKFVVPILSNLIHHYGVGEDYTYLNIASEVYAVNEELFFVQ